ncbi:MAG: hypothetical protein IPG63_16270 [Xanthomonadales bacterium]|nr:hypothetical protein [Xanthomonadales bacterium]
MTRSRWLALALCCAFATVPAVAGDAETPVTARPTQSVLELDRVEAPRGASEVLVPIRIQDRRGTPLGPEQPRQAQVQGIALRVRILPGTAVTSAQIERAGLLTNVVPLFEVNPRTADGASWLVSLDAGLFGPRQTTDATGMVAQLRLRLAPGLASGARIRLQLDPGTSLLANRDGSIEESIGNGWLELRDGSIKVP